MCVLCFLVGILVPIVFCYYQITRSFLEGLSVAEKKSYIGLHGYYSVEEERTREPVKSFWIIVSESRNASHTV